MQVLEEGGVIEKGRPTMKGMQRPCAGWRGIERPYEWKAYID